MNNIFDAFGDFFQGHRLFGESRPRQQGLSPRARTLIATINADDLVRYAQHKEQAKSIFNPRNKERLVHYKAERLYLLDRDRRCCGYCGDNSQEKPLQPDHIIPYSKLPVTHLDNLVMSCADCNSGKSDGIVSKATLREVLQMVQERNNAHFPRRKYGDYRRDYGKLVL